MSIPEFLDFFSTPAQVRMAKAASSAVRMSLDLLQLTAEEEYLRMHGDEEEDEVEEGGSAGEEGKSKSGDTAADGEDHNLKV